MISGGLRSRDDHVSFSSVGQSCDAALRGGAVRAASSAAALLAVLGLLPGPVALRADDHADRRVEAGLKIFRALLAADSDLPRKPVDGKLVVLFFYTDDVARAGSLAKVFGKGELAQPEPVHGIPAVLELTSDPTFAAYARRVPAGIFLAQAPGPGPLEAVVRFGIANHVIVYSPFEGHVERGVLGGLAVEAQVRPYLNLTTLGASSVNLKEFFLKVAKVTR